MELTDLIVSQNGNQNIVIAGNRTFRVDNSLYALINVMREGSDLKNAISQIAKKYNLSNIELELKFNEFFKEIQKRTLSQDSYIKSRLNLCSEKVIILLSKFFKPLFSSKVILLLFSIAFFSTCFIITDIGFERNYKYFNIIQLIILSSLCIVFTFIHEIGHATASYRFGCPAANIGLGFYIFFPVFYTDVSRIWILQRNERLIVNIGGVYFQLIINLFLIFSFYLSQSLIVKEWLSYLILSNSIVIMYSLTPFFRNDGYWILSDILSIPNLLRTSDIWFIDLIRGKKIKWDFRIAIFAICNYLFRLWIILKLCTGIINTCHSILYSSNTSSLIKLLAIDIFFIVALYLLCYSLIKKIKRYAST